MRATSVSGRSIDRIRVYSVSSLEDKSLRGGGGYAKFGGGHPPSRELTLNDRLHRRRVSSPSALFRAGVGQLPAGSDHCWATPHAPPLQSLCDLSLVDDG